MQHVLSASCASEAAPQTLAPLAQPPRLPVVYLLPVASSTISGMQDVAAKPDVS
jgi:hypothetical protein